MMTRLLWIAVALAAGLLALACESDDTGSDDDDSSSDADADTDTDSDSDSDTDSDTGQIGLCGFTGEAEVTAESYQGTQEYYLIGDSGTGEHLCQVRLELNSVQETPPECGICEWTFVVEVNNPEVIADVDGACVNSSFALDEAGIEAMVGTRMPYGYVTEYQGHENVLMEYADEKWNPISLASWDPETGEFSYDKRIGWCDY